MSDQQEQGAKERLMQAAISLFAEKGYAATSVREIVALAGVTKPVLYYYFGSKEGLFKALIDEAKALQENLIGEALETRGDTWSRLVAVVTMVLDLAAANIDFVRMLHSVILGPRNGIPSWDVYGLRQQFFEGLTTIIQDGQARGELREVEVTPAVFLILSIIDTSIELMIYLPELATPDRPLQMLQLVFSGLARGEGHHGS